MNSTIAAVKLYFPDADRHAIGDAIEKCLKDGQVAPGKSVEEFEAIFARYTRCRHALALNSGGGALEVAMRGLNIAGSQVLVPTNTFLATAGSVLAAGGTPKLVDIDPHTAAPSATQIGLAIEPHTKGVIVVHIGGIITPDLPEIRRICAAQGIWLFEDCAHAHGSTLGGISAGNFGIGGAYSFCSTKVITCGEGGMLVTNNDSLAATAKLLRNYGKPEPWGSYSVQFGMNWRLNELAAIVGISQLKRLDEIIEQRAAIADTYNRLLSTLPGFFSLQPTERSSWYKYIVLLPPHIDQKHLRDRLLGANIRLPGGVYDIPLHRQPALEHLGHGAEFPGAEDFAARHVCLPVYPGMTYHAVEYVAEQVCRAWQPL